MILININYFIENNELVVVTGITLRWTDNSDNETSFVVESCQELVSGKGKNKTVTCNFSHLLETVNPNNANEISLTVSPDGSNRFRVKASNDVGSSGYSNEAKI